MRWVGERQSQNVEDRRGMRGGPQLALGGGVGTLVMIVLWLLLGGNPGMLLNQNMPVAPAPQGAADDELKRFVSVVLADTEDVWHELFQQKVGKPYREPTLVLFSGRVESSCGLASAAVGPFYCPRDEKVYLDLSFFQELRMRFRAPGDFAMAYVIAHEVGHHVQQLLGSMQEVDRVRMRGNEVETNHMSVRLELQADFLAGVWAHHAQRTKHILEEGDIEEALRAANAIGDDRLQKQSQGYVVPDSFTHGTSEQRMRWFRKGLETGDLSLMRELFRVPQDQL